MPDLVIPLICVLILVSVALGAHTLAELLLSARDRRRRVNRRLTMLASGQAPEQVYAALVREPISAGTGAFWRAWRPRLSAALAQAGLRITPEQTITLVGAGAAVLWVISLVLASSAPGSDIVAGGLLSLVGSLLLSGGGVWLWIGACRRRRLARLEAQFPVALDIIGRALRAGHPVISAVHLAAEELPDPTGSELGLVVDETSYGMDFREALAHFARRTGSSDAHFFAVSVSIQSETGGNLAEILEGLSAVMRGRATLAQRVKALSSEGRASALLMSVLPIGLLAVQLLIHPAAYAAKVADPIFWPVAGVAAVLYVTGWVAVRRIINFRY
ncbi:MAG: hypothetical protein EPO51_10395 [Phenylobacterium sp.]|uniref:type II secretion system F family protein n=1 Tax=Phenylobacterium sp. TaxID=1871053 RepID=UPI00122B8A54|nr:type II secretion system F family protein [Phenylobacterium sp.]TAJ72497.1 MAG: hypothetical protein EPO51_10395 [Phenylobacterium sp.]